MKKTTAVLLLRLISIGALVSLMGFLILNLVSGRPKSSPSIELMSSTGMHVTNFFDDLPVNPGFAGGNNGFTPDRTARSCAAPSLFAQIGDKLRMAFGSVTVHAQSGCNGCYKRQYQTSCGYPCNGGMYWVSDTNGPCSAGDYFQSIIPCGSCVQSKFTICSNSDVCHCS